ncbi:hypothetical protein EDC01DRAFT_626560 [Geopyxis carbonaria]|nr:hypothetical protein EDC01DRAFT_626560 [Geopyxis carbonaria]
MPPHRKPIASDHPTHCLPTPNIRTNSELPSDDEIAKRFNEMDFNERATQGHPKWSIDKELNHNSKRLFELLRNPPANAAPHIRVAWPILPPKEREKIIASYSSSTDNQEQSSECINTPSEDDQLSNPSKTPSDDEELSERSGKTPEPHLSGSSPTASLAGSLRSVSSQESLPQVIPYPKHRWGPGMSTNDILAEIAARNASFRGRRGGRGRGAGRGRQQPHVEIFRKVETYEVLLLSRDIIAEGRRMNPGRRPGSVSPPPGSKGWQPAAPVPANQPRVDISVFDMNKRNKPKAESPAKKYFGTDQ